jgi:hypothetical protein
MTPASSILHWMAKGHTQHDVGQGALVELWYSELARFAPARSGCFERLAIGDGRHVEV